MSEGYETPWYGPGAYIYDVTGWGTHRPSSTRDSELFRILKEKGYFKRKTLDKIKESSKNVQAALKIL